MFTLQKLSCGSSIFATKILKNLMDPSLAQWDKLVGKVGTFLILLVYKLKPKFLVILRVYCSQ